MLYILEMFAGHFESPDNTHLGQGWSSVLGNVGSWDTSAIIWVNSLEETPKNQITNSYPAEYLLLLTEQTHCGMTYYQRRNPLLWDFTKYILKKQEISKSARKQWR